MTARSTLNFVGAGVTAVDDAANDRVNVTIPGAGELVQAVLNGSDTFIAAGVTVNLPFIADSSFDWLDFTDLTEPVVQDAGIYAMTFAALCSTGAVPFYISLNYPWDDIHSAAVFPEVQGSVSLTTHFDAGSTFSATLQNRSGASHSFRIQQFVIVKVAAQ